MDFSLKEYHRHIPDDELISDLKSVACKANRDTLTSGEYKAFGGRFDVRTFGRRFGSWSAAVRTAGLQTRAMNVPETELFENLAEVWTNLGRQPTHNETVRPLSRYDATTYKRRFGSWRKALEEFVGWANADPVESTRPVTKRRTPRDANLRLRWQVMNRDHFKCRACGRSPATHSGVELQVDHIVAWSRGGETVFENLQTLCAQCNNGKSDLV